MSLIALKHEDTRRILTLTGALLVVSIVVASKTDLWWVAVVPPLAFLGLALLIAHYFRAQEENLVWQAQDIQDLQFIQSAIQPVRPLPYLTRWSCSPALAARLIGLIQEHRPARIVELGSGVSTLVMAYAARSVGSGRITSLDHDLEYAAITRRELRAHGMTDLATVHDAPLRPVDTTRGSRAWYDPSVLDGLEEIDLLVVDGPPRKSGPDARWPAFDLLRSRLSPGAIVLLDDTARSDEDASVASWTSAAAEDGVRQLFCRKGVTIIRMPG